ncbi:MAG: hypothetical protein ABR611_07235 [Chthoniobacterales bacterium]
MKTRTINAAFVFGIAALLFLQGASAAKPKPKSKSEPAADYFPLRVGDTWSYRNTSEGGYTWKILNQEPQQGGAVRYIAELDAGVKVLKTFSKADGWVLFHGENYPEHEGLQMTYEPPRQYLPNPMVVGQKWEWTGKDTTQMELQEKNHVVGVEIVTVVAGKFRAMKVVTEITGASTPIIRTSWYADGVGLVKTKTEAGAIKYGSELTDYSFKKKPRK